MTDAEKLRWRIEDYPPHTILVLDGVLDLRTAPLLRAAALKALAAHPTCLIIDAAEVRLTEDIAATVLPTLALNAAVWPGSAVVLCATSPALLSRLARMGTRQRIAVCHSLAQAKDIASTQPVLPRFRERLPMSPQAPRRARGLVDRACRSWGLAHAVEPARTIASELVSNAVLHAHSESVLTLTLRERYLHLAVSDGSQQTPRQRTPEADGGRGLLLVEALSVAWGTEVTAAGKRVWATLSAE
ncbi:ATP-binding protein [Allokutzneria albata]|uniref:Anti-anti-sigma regulatory factor (Antagonist of anti-sigma factor) n=1 Tax=Allokutzneria albata TaxID=211114 RepID=A0A1G9R299_ALLAB|nr:ATP-binding protein [Allokutzneria albata]SDM17261.1 Anti-anti-sigma regulatory factor (antagonist of anti-sigma factor) [Allokutzneria albata]